MRSWGASKSLPSLQYDNFYLHVVASSFGVLRVLRASKSLDIELLSASLSSHHESRCDTGNQYAGKWIGDLSPNLA